jgi:malate dehydrogenase (oxaloacetate-decarboxylating)(NADP+)
MDSGVATRPITDMAAYKEKLTGFIYRTGVGMRSVFYAAKQGKPKRIVYHRGRGRARAARRPDHRRRRASGHADPDRSPRRDRRAAGKDRLGKLRVGEHSRSSTRISDERYKECWTRTTTLMRRAASPWRSPRRACASTTPSSAP